MISQGQGQHCRGQGRGTHDQTDDEDGKGGVRIDKPS